MAELDGLGLMPAKAAVALRSLHSDRTEDERRRIAARRGGDSAVASEASSEIVAVVKPTLHEVPAKRC